MFCPLSLWSLYYLCFLILPLIASVSSKKERKKERKKDEQRDDRHGELLLFVFNVNIMSFKEADDNVHIVYVNKCSCRLHGYEIAKMNHILKWMFNVIHDAGNMSKEHIKYLKRIYNC